MRLARIEAALETTVSSAGGICYGLKDTTAHNSEIIEQLVSFLGQEIEKTCPSKYTMKMVNKKEN